MTREEVERLVALVAERDALSKAHIQLQRSLDVASAERDALRKELACRDALISDHLRKIMHLENRIEEETCAKDAALCAAYAKRGER